MTAQALLTEPEAAQALRVCTRTLRKARQEGKLTYVLIGRSVRYTMDDLASFIEASRQDAPPCEKPSRRVTTRQRNSKIVPFTARRKHDRL